MVMIIQYNTGKCETMPVSEAKRLWFALTGEKRGRAGYKAKARQVKRWFFPPHEAPASFRRAQALKSEEIQPELTDAELPYWQK
jgi:hypothetical protein